MAFKIKRRTANWESNDHCLSMPIIYYNPATEKYSVPLKFIFFEGFVCDCIFFAFFFFFLNISCVSRSLRSRKHWRCG